MKIVYTMVLLFGQDSFFAVEDQFDSHEACLSKRAEMINAAPYPKYHAEKLTGITCVDQLYIIGKAI